MNETKKRLEKTMNNSEFSYQDWLDGFTAKINEIPFISAWTGHTVNIVNQQSKKISFAGMWSMDNEDDIMQLGRITTDNYTRRCYPSYRFDSVEGWVSSSEDKHPLSFGAISLYGKYTPNQTKDVFAKWRKNPTAHRVLYRVSINFEGRGTDGEAIFVYFPEYNTIRRLGYWEYKSYWLTKYIPYKIKNNYGWKSWRDIKNTLV
tara:strand:+ start:138 stop:749 length:612 start_codon:yes stop_codon:yes gene_type:complete